MGPQSLNGGPQKALRQPRPPESFLPTVDNLYHRGTGLLCYSNGAMATNFCSVPIVTATGMAIEKVRLMSTIASG